MAVTRMDNGHGFMLWILYIAIWSSKSESLSLHNHHHQFWGLGSKNEQAKLVDICSENDSIWCRGNFSNEARCKIDKLGVMWAKVHAVH